MAKEHTITFAEAAENWKAMRKLIPGWANTRAKNLRHAVAVAQVEEMRDAPSEDEWRDKSDDGPLRIVSSRLARSLIGNADLNAKWNLFSTNRLVQIEEGGYSEVYYSYRVSPGNTHSIHIAHGTTVPYADIHEYGKGKIEARPFFVPGAERAHEWFIEKMISSNSLGNAMMDALTGEIF